MKAIRDNIIVLERNVASKVLIENQMTRFVGVFDYSSSSVSSSMILRLKFNVDTSQDELKARRAKLHYKLYIISAYTSVHL